MGKNVFFAVFFFFFAAALRLFFCGTAFAIQPGRMAPPFTLDDTSGRPVSIAAFKGKVIVLNFFAAGCPPCEKEVATLNRLYLKYRARGLVVLGVASDGGEDVKDYVARHPAAYPVLVDVRSTAHILYDVLPVPVTFLINGRGFIAGKFFGPPEDQTLEKDILRLLSQHG